jgi:hypothetical protein
MEKILEMFKFNDVNYESELLKKHAYTMVFLLLLVNLTWYYLTLPGSILSLDKNKSCKPSFLTTLKQWLIYNMFTFMALIHVFMSLNGDSAPSS